MASEVQNAPAYRHTMERLEEIKRESSQGVEFWLARDVASVLGYQTWDKFVPAIERATESMRANGVDPSHHFSQTGKMMGLGKGAMREGVDYFLSRAACYLIAMNGDTSKPEVAAAQAYFATQTRSAELARQHAADHKRLSMREKVAAAVKRVGAVAKDAGVTRYDWFHNVRYQGLYGLGRRAVESAKGVGEGESLFDRAGPLELAAHEFQMQLAATKIVNEGINGEQRAIDANLAVARDVRATVEKQGVNLAKLPLEPEPIAVVKKRVAQQRRLPKRGNG